MIDGIGMATGEVARIEADGTTVMLCRQTDTEWTLSLDRWGTGVRQISAAIILMEEGDQASWRVVAMPGKRNPRDVLTWSIAIDAALTIR